MISEDRNSHPYDIFISYRRKTGADDARLLQQALKARGFNVFFDYDSLRDGQFDKRIYAAIEEAPFFILMLSEGALDNCVNEDDWVRLEIEHALKHKRKIIPVAVNPSAWTFPECLPEKIMEGIKNEQISELNKASLFDASIDEIISQRIKSNRSFTNGVISAAHKIVVPVVAAFQRHMLLLLGVLIMIPFLCGISLWMLSEFSNLHAENQEYDRVVESTVANISVQCAFYDQMVGAALQMIECADKYHLEKDGFRKDGYRQDLYMSVEQLKELLRSQETMKCDILPEELLKDIKSVDINCADVILLYDSVKMWRDRLKRLYIEPLEQSLKDSKIKPQRSALLSARIDIYAGICTFSCNVMNIFRKVRSDVLDDFKRYKVSLWKNLYIPRGDWPLLPKDFSRIEEQLAAYMRLKHQKIRFIALAEETEAFVGLDGKTPSSDFIEQVKKDLDDFFIGGKWIKDCL